MKKSNVKPRPASTKNKSKWRDMAITILAFVSVGATLVWIVWMAHNSVPPQPGHNHLTGLPESTTQLNPHKVCMSTNAFMGDYPLMPVSDVTGTYYACSEHCKDALLSNEAERYAIDPISKNRVNKAQAIICVHPDKSGKVCYFESKENHLAFVKLQKL